MAPGPDITWLEPPQGLTLLAELRFPPGCVWFEGHFPDRPVLPGVALLAAVRAAVARGSSEGGTPARVVGFGRVRFRRTVGPGETLHLALGPGRAAHTLRFTYAIGQEDVCDGMARWAEEPETCRAVDVWAWR